MIEERRGFFRRRSDWGYEGDFDLDGSGWLGDRWEWLKARRARFAILAVLLTGAYFLLVNPFIGGAASKHPFYLVLGDTSLDTPLAIRQENQAELNQVAAEAKRRHAYIAADRFQADAVSEADWQTEDFTLDASLVHNSRKAQNYLDSQAADFRKKTTGLFERQDRHVDGTDILGVLTATRDEFSTYPNGTTRSIIITSNMANVTYVKEEGSDALNLKIAHPLAYLEGRVEKFYEEGIIPDLKSACVWIVGGGRIPVKPLPPRVERSIHQFWTSYFARAHARVMGWVSALAFPLVCPPLAPRNHP